MQLQVELYNAGERQVRWLKSNINLVAGRKLILADDIGRVWTVLRTFISLPDWAELPPKARKGTSLCFLEGDNTADMQAAFPQIFVL